MIKESIIDIPRRTYAKGVFDDADTNNPKLKSVVIGMIMKQLKDFEERFAPIVKYSLIGSILTKRYRNDADLDINVLFDVPPGDRETMRKTIAKSLKDVNGKLVPGTEHPINYYVITDPKVKEKNDAMADGVFDVKTNKFIRRPKDDKFDAGKYVSDFQKKVSEIDVVKGELIRDIIDYKELQGLGKDEVENLSSMIEKKLDEILDSLKILADAGDAIVKDRQSAFELDMTPDEVREFGKKHKLPKNIIYKMMEKYHYLKFYKKVKEILDDGKVTDAEIDSLKNESIASAWDTLIRRTIKAPKMAAGINLYLKYVRSGMKDAKHKAAQHVGIDYREFQHALADVGLPESVTEAVGRTVAFTFGRFNPPTIGHEKLINKVKSAGGNDYRIFLSRSQDTQKNPLVPSEKLSIMHKLFPQHRSKIQLHNSNQVLEIVVSLYEQGFKNIIMVVGSDRVREFDNILQRYNGEKNRHGYYNFDSIRVVSAGDRDPDSEGVTGMSASKMRDAAKRGDLNSFRQGLPSNADAERIMKQVRKGMRLAAGFEPNKPMTFTEFQQSTLRDMYVREVLFNIGDRVQNIKEEKEGKVVRRGTNYIVLEDNSNNLIKSWIWDCVPVTSDREVEIREHNLNVDYGFTLEEKMDKSPQDKTVGKDKPGTQPKKYYKGLSKDDKSKRADHFRNQEYKKGDKNYKPAPGDKDAETKPSKHTQKYKKMFGELRKELDDACWAGYKQVGMKDKNGKKVPNCVPESYDIGHDYAQHTLSMTPGQVGYDPNYQGGKYEPSTHENNQKRVYNGPDDVNKVDKEDVEKWAVSDEVIDKYKKRYAEQWKAKLDEVVRRMLENL